MRRKISSKADMSSIHYEGRALVSEIEDIAAMETGDWRARLETALKKSGKSKRAVSLAAGLGAGYMHSILAEGKDPTIDNLIAVCNEVGISLSAVLYGYDLTAENEEILRLLQASSPAAREGLLAVLREKSGS